MKAAIGLALILAACGGIDSSSPDARTGVVAQAVTIDGSDFGGADLTPNDGDVLSGVFTNVGTFTIASGITVTVAPGVALDVAATTTVIDGVLDGNGAGSPGGAGAPSGPNTGGNGEGPGGGRGGEGGACVHGGGGGGGGYGGIGGEGGYLFDNGTGLHPNGGASYGSDVDAQVELGSGGGGGGSGCSDPGVAGGVGGGSIRIFGTSITIDGAIRVNGTDGSVQPSFAGGGGGGSGGGIGLFANAIGGTGSLSVRGGNGGANNPGGLEGDGGGGAGGKIKVTGAIALAIDVGGGVAGGPCNANSAFCPSDGGAGKLLVIGPRVTANPSPIAFGPVRVGQISAPQILHLQNTGGADLTITTITGSPEFAVTGGSLPITLSPGSETTAIVTFSPSAPGPADGSITVISNDPESPLAVPANGFGTAPVISVDPSSIDFSDQRVGTTGNHLVTVTNVGDAPLRISAVGASAPFSNANSFPIDLDPGQPTTLTVNFTPSAPGPVSDQVTIISDAATSPTAINVTGNGIAPAVSLPSGFSFGNQRVGTTSQFKSVLLTNSGTDTLTVSNVTIAGPFTILTPTVFPFTVDPGGGIVIDMTFSPTAAGATSQVLSITSDAATSPNAIDIGGTGIVPELTVSTPAIGFGTVKVGTTSTGQPLTLTNSSATTAQITAASVPAPFALQDPGFPINLLPGASVTVFVTFAPAASGAASGPLTFTSDAPSNPTVQLTGMGGTSQVAVDPQSFDFGEVPVGTSAPLMPVSIRNSGASPLVITTVDVAAPFVRTSLQLPITLDPGASVALGLMFLPTDVGEVSGSIAIQSDGGTTSIPLSGKGIFLGDEEPGGCCSSSGSGSAWLGVLILGLVRRRRHR